MKSIIFISVMNGSAWGGSEEQWFRIAKTLSPGCKMVICTFDWPERVKKLKQIQSNNCQTILLPHKGSGLIRNWKIKRILQKINFSEFECAYINQGGWKDVTHGPFKNLFKSLPPYALSFHSYQLNAGLSISKQKLLSEWIKHSRICINASSAIIRMLRQEYKIDSKKTIISYSPLSFDPPHNLPLPRDLSVPVFITLGSLDTETKAQDLLIAVLGRDEWKKRNWQLNIYGEGKDRVYLSSLITKLGLEGKVELKGHTHDVQAAIAGANMLIQATRYDAMPISVMEAMAMGRPCLVSQLGDMPEWVKPGYNGYIVEGLSEERLAEQLEIAWNERESWDQLGKNAFMTFREKYPLPYEEKFIGLLNKHLCHT